MSLRRLFRVGIFLASLLSAAAATQAGLEQPACAATSDKPKVAVGGFSGDKSGEIRDAFLSALRDEGSYEITDADDVKAAANTRAVADAASAMGVNIVITGKVSGNSLKLKVMGADGKQLDTPEIKGAARAKLKTNIHKSASSSVATSIDRAMAAEKAKAEKDEQARAKQSETQAEADSDADADADAEPEADTDTGGGLSPLDITAGLRAMNRNFTFHQTLAELRPSDGFAKFLSFKLPLGPVVFIDLNWYPGAHFAKGQAERIGLTAGYERGFAITSVYEPEGGTKRSLTTKEQAFYVGARYRLPIAAHELGAAAAYGQHTFLLSGDNGAPLVPDVKYKYIKLGLDGRLRIGVISVGARVGTRFVLDTGALESVWFPGSVKTKSLEAGATVGYRLLPVLEVVGSFDWLRYAFDFNPVTQRAGFESAVAGGAVDQYFYAGLGLRFHVPGAEPQAAATPSRPSARDKDE